MEKLIRKSRKDPTLEQTKSSLAKLMATENITVRHRHTKTVFFDLKNRVLNLPIWKDMNSDIYDLLVGHEISHALHTPLLGWHDTLEVDIKDKNRPKIKHFLNITEDARIEKIIKRKYPGIRRPFSEAYKNLFDRDFFGIKGQNLSELRFIDRFNLYFKIGVHLNLSFDKEEQIFIDRGESLETFEEAAQLARDIYDYAKYKEQKEKKKKKDKSDKLDKSEDQSKEKSDEESEDNSSDGEENESSAGDEDDEDGDIESSAGDEDVEDDIESESIDEDGESKDELSGSDDKESDTEEAGGNEAGSSDDLEEPSAITDEAYREHEKDLINHYGTAICYLDIPKANLDRIIVPHKMVFGKYEISISSQIKTLGKTYIDVAAGLNAAFHRRNRGFIAMLVKEFEMRKNANQYARQLTSKTGELDDKKIARFKLTNDIFRKVTMIPKGKSHGMVMFIDLSGSMTSTIREIFEQLLILCTFCKKIGIPFDVYGFGDNHKYSFGAGAKCMWEPVNGGFTFFEDNYCLRHMISSTLKSNAYKKAFTMINVLGQISNEKDRDPESDKCLQPKWIGNIYACGFELGRTPFNQTLVASKYIIEEFKKQHRVDITNVIYLTDGDGTGSILNGDVYNSIQLDERKKTRFGVRDPKTKMTVITDMGISYQTALTKLVAAVTGCVHIGYYFSVRDDIIRRIGDNKENAAFLDKNGFVAVPNIGYDNYYYVNQNQMRYSGELFPSENKDELASKFTDHLQAKMNSKLIIKEFATDIAE